MKTTSERLCGILVKDYKLDPMSLTDDAQLDQLGIDSLGLAELMFNIEDEFQIDLPATQVALQSLGDVVNYIDEVRLAQQIKKDLSTVDVTQFPSAN